MHIIRLDDDTIMHGRLTFEIYLTRAACGPNSPAYKDGPCPPSGAAMIVGAILECIDHHITTHGDIIHAVSRATRCRTTTVETFLSFFEGNDPDCHLWFTIEGHYGQLKTGSLSDESFTSVLLAA